MVHFERTHAGDARFHELVKRLDAELGGRYGEDQAFFDTFNKLHDIRYVVLAIEDGSAIACGAIKHFDDNTMEIKRMFTDPAYRGRSVAAGILQELESWAHELGYGSCILETGVLQPEAIRLYQKCNYTQIPNYGQYEGVEISVCFLKNLS